MTVLRYRLRAAVNGLRALSRVPKVRRNRGRRVDFMIVGAQKCGTTALFDILSQHSQIGGPLRKETNFFTTDACTSQKHLDRYHALFASDDFADPAKKLFEATPSYLREPDVPGRLHAYNPDLKIIVLLRDPTARALSAWAMYHHGFKAGPHKGLHDPRTFPEAVDDELTGKMAPLRENFRSYVLRGIYVAQIRAFQAYFDDSQLFIGHGADLRDDFEAFSRSVQKFIGVPYEGLASMQSNTRKVSNKSQYLEEHKRLDAFFAPYNKELEELTGRRFGWGQT